ncbi:hypothetical protein [Devosia sp. Leaf64]|uniref:hypothetical protein n=1 Tax=Devosia sp. Leaf64 TaxID=1736229 RepID=UPI000715CAE8|nr:hypothetical protein [Devosia sp. Leaf64]KQN75041.1 hypothetical protein ASE94_01600 [Devosia sp. Leaf64]
MKQARRPDTQACDRAIVEAVSFKFSEVLRDIRQRTEGDREEAARLMVTAMVGVSTLAALACQILVDRYGYDRTATVKAIHLRIAKRDEHDDPSFFPSLNPDHEAQADRMESVRQARCLTSNPDGDLVGA